MSDDTQKSIHLHKRAWAYSWLAYTGFLFIQPTVEPSLWLWIATLVSVGIFLLLVFHYSLNAFGCNPKRPLRAVAATFVLALLTFPWNPGAITYFIYAAAFTPFNVRSTNRILGFFALESFGVLAERYVFRTYIGVFHVSWDNAIMAIILLVIIGCGNIFFAEQKRADSKLRMAHTEIEALAAIAERERIARDLHDVLGHTLSLITLKAELAGRLIETDPTRAAAEIAEVERTARTALAEVREAIGGYRARGLAAEVETARRTLDAAGVTLLLVDSQTPAPQNPASTDPASTDPGAPFMPKHLGHEWDSTTVDHPTSHPTTTLSTPHLASEMWASTNLTAAEETILALALREAITNIVRHAQAKTCRLRFLTEDGHHRLLIEDDGSHPLLREGNGLRGMRERIESIGGHLTLDNKNGTRLLIELPQATSS